MAVETTTGLDEFLLSLESLPPRYRSIKAQHLEAAHRARRKGTRGFGPSVERVVEDVLDFEDLPASRPGPVYPEGYVRPDFGVSQRTFIEVTKWGDSNKLSSILANGILLKSKLPNANYFAVVASYGVTGGWTYDPDVEFYLDQAPTGLPFRPVDGYSGFPRIDRLVGRIKETLR